MPCPQDDLSVFRQIPEEPLLVFDEATGEFNLAGVPWGLVNYYWGDAIRLSSGERHMIITSYCSDINSCLDLSNIQKYEQALLKKMEAHSYQYEKLAELDQLFIAV